MSSLAQRIRDVSLTIFELSDEIEQACQAIEGRSIVASAVVERHCVQPNFVQDLIDFELFDLFASEIELQSIPKFAGNNRDIKSALKAIVPKLSSEFHKSLTTGANDVLTRASFTLCKSCAENKQLFLNNLTITLIVQCLQSKLNQPLLAMVSTLIADDDPTSKNPAHIFARDQLLETCNLDPFRALLSEIKPEEAHTATILKIVRELSVSQKVSKLLAIDDRFLEYATCTLAKSSVPAHRVAAARYLRQVSFADDMKKDVMEALSLSNALGGWIELSFDDSQLCVNLLATLANLTLKSPKVSIQLLQAHPAIFSLMKTVLNRPSSNESTACMQFTRSFAKSPEGVIFLNDSLLTELNAVRVLGSDVSKKIADDILYRLTKTVHS